MMFLPTFFGLVSADKISLVFWLAEGVRKGKSLENYDINGNIQFVYEEDLKSCNGKSIKTNNKF